MTLPQSLTITSSHKWWVFSAVSIGHFVSVMDQTGLTVAIPPIANHFNATIPTVQWIVLGYILSISALLLPMGRIADLVGRKRIYILGFIIFTTGAAIASFSPNLGVLIALRMAQGVGTAMVQATSMAIVIITVVGLGAIVGPVVAGTMVGSFGWPSIFLLSVPLGILSIAIAALVLRQGEGQEAPTSRLMDFDFAGATLSTAAMVGFLVILTFGQQVGWTSLIIITSSTGVLALSLGFIFWEIRISDPLIPLTLFKKARFSFGATASFLSFMSTTTIFFLMPFFLQQIQGYTPGQTGLVLITSAICMATVGPMAGRLSDRFGSKLFTVTGLSLSTTGFIVFSQLDQSTSLLIIVVGLLLSGSGMAMFSSPNSSSILGSVDRASYGVTTAFLNLIRNSANITGLALATTIVTATMASAGFEPSLSAVSAEGGGVTLAFTRGLGFAFTVAAVLSGTALILAATHGQPARQA
jgi:EmrB/QacA subfamily drug resistance transporter